MADRDPRDLNTIPNAFGAFLGTMRKPNRYGEVLFYGKIYWIYGNPPRDCAAPGVQDPPCSGWSVALMLDDPLYEDEKHVTLFHPWTMQAWRVRRDCYELTSFQGDIEGFPWDRLQHSLPRVWAEFRRRGDASADYDVARRVMEAMGVKVPTDEELGDIPLMERGPVATSHAPAPVKKAEAGFKPVKPDGRRGEVLKFFLDRKGMASVAAATSQFGITRSNLLSQLFLLRKEHGIGYAVSGDQASIQLPEGVEDPFK